MTGAFETLIYTDCRPGQGMQGSGGLQFQARSAGAQREAMTVVQRSLLYEPPSTWMRERRPVTDYPPSFAHVWDGYLATAAGVYLGREANGSREGNQLTHSIVTRDPDAYAAPIRPAQLYKASFWVAEAAPTTVCPPLAPGWQPGPFGVEETRAFVVAQRGGRDMLVSLLAALQQIGTPQASRILFIAEDPDAVLRWILAGTLLLPHREALAVGFKVFSTDPARATQPVVATHAGWDSTPARVGNDLGYAVFDLARGEFSRVQSTDETEMWVDEFCAGEDPYDVIDAIEVAAESRLSSVDAAVLGRAAVLGDKLTLDNATVVAAWLRDSPTDLLANYRGSMLDRLVDSVDQWPQRILLDLDELGRSGQVPSDRAAPVRLALIRAELERAARTAEAAEVALPELPIGAWSPHHRDGAERAVVQCLRTTSAAGFDAVLRVAQRFGLAVDLTEVAPFADAFVAEWAEQPERGYDVRAWPCGPQLEDLLVERLNARMPDNRDAAADLARRWWPSLGHRIDGDVVEGPTYEALLGVGLPRLALPARERLVRRVLEHVRHSAPDEQAAGRLVSALWSVAAPATEELTLVARMVPPGAPLHQRLFDDLAGRLVKDELVAADLTLARSLAARRLLWPNAAMGQLLRDDATLVNVCARLRSGERDVPVQRLVADLRRVARRVVAARADDVVLAVLHVRRPNEVKSLLEAVPSIAHPYVVKLAAALKEPDSAPHAVTAFYLSLRPDVSDRVRKNLDAAMTKWIQNAPEEALSKATTMVEELGDAWREAWRDDVASIHGKGLLKRLFSRGRR